MQIGQLARELGVTTKTLRHYESVGLIPSAQRTAAGYRVYDAAAVRRARLVVGLRGLGLPVETVRELLVPGAGGNLRQRLLGRLDEEVQGLDVQIAILQGRRDDLEARYRAILGSPDGPDDCVCAATLQACKCGR